jgi:hypothetical protein
MFVPGCHIGICPASWRVHWHQHARSFRAYVPWGVRILPGLQQPVSIQPAHSLQGHAFTSPPGWFSAALRRRVYAAPTGCISCITCIPSFYHKRQHSRGLRQNSRSKRPSLHLHNPLPRKPQSPPDRSANPLLTDAPYCTIPPPSRECSPEFASEALSVPRTISQLTIIRENPRSSVAVLAFRVFRVFRGRHLPVLRFPD